MSVAAWCSLVAIGGLVWGGFLTALSRAMMSERRRDRDE